MTTTAELATATALALDIEPVTVRQYARRLREAGWQSQRGRGRGAATATARDAAVLLLGLAASELAVAAPAAVARYFEAAPILHPVPGLAASFEAHWPALDLAARPACTGTDARATWRGKPFGEVLVALIGYAATLGELRDADSGRVYDDLHVEVTRGDTHACIGLTCGADQWFVRYFLDAPTTPRLMHVGATFGRPVIELLGHVVAGDFS